MQTYKQTRSQVSIIHYTKLGHASDEIFLSDSLATFITTSPWGIYWCVCQHLCNIAYHYTYIHLHTLRTTMVIAYNAITVGFVFVLWDFTTALTVAGRAFLSLLSSFLFLPPRNEVNSSPETCGILFRSCKNNIKALNTGDSCTLAHAQVCACIWLVSECMGACVCVWGYCMFGVKSVKRLYDFRRCLDALSADFVLRSRMQQ